MRLIQWLGCALVFLAAQPTMAETVYPAPTWQPQASALASEFAYPGGTLRVYAGQYPSSFNYLLDASVFSSQLFALQFEPLLTRNAQTLAREPNIAEKVVVSDDKLTFTIHLNPAARWSDGTPISADDLLWTWAAMTDDAHLTGPHKVGLMKFHSPQKVDAHTVSVKAKSVHWKNLSTISGFTPLPSHWWRTQEFNKVNFQFPVISGAYAIDEIKESHSVTLRRRADYWGSDDPRLVGLNNFDVLKFVFYGERDIAYDHFRQDGFDVFAVYQSHRWVSQTLGAAYDNNWIVKQRVHNQAPVGFQGFVMNLRRPLFADARVRRALAHSLDRQRMNETLMHSQYFLHSSYWEDLYDASQPNNNVRIDFDLDKARALLKEAGWTLSEDGVLRRAGQAFVINFLTRSASSDKFLLIYREALEKLGISLTIERKDWSAWTQDMDEYNFDMTWAAWGAAIDKDPEAMWHSAHADQPSGQNLSGYRNAQVDALIDAMRDEFDLQKRHALLRKIDQILTEDNPYILLWNGNSTRMLYWNRFGMPEHRLGKYDKEWATLSYWWADIDLDEELIEARAQSAKLPDQPFEVDFATFADALSARAPLQ